MKAAQGVSGCHGQAEGIFSPLGCASHRQAPRSTWHPLAGVKTKPGRKHALDNAGALKAVDRDTWEFLLRAGFGKPLPEELPLPVVRKVALALCNAVSDEAFQAKLQRCPPSGTPPCGPWSSTCQK